MDLEKKQIEIAVQLQRIDSKLVLTTQKTKKRLGDGAALRRGVKAYIARQTR